MQEWQNETNQKWKQIRNGRMQKWITNERMKKGRN